MREGSWRVIPRGSEEGRVIVKLREREGIAVKEVSISLVDID